MGFGPWGRHWARFRLYRQCWDACQPHLPTQVLASPGFASSYATRCPAASTLNHLTFESSTCWAMGTGALPIAKPGVWAHPERMTAARAPTEPAPAPVRLVMSVLLASLSIRLAAGDRRVDVTCPIRGIKLPRRRYHRGRTACRGEAGRGACGSVGGGRRWPCWPAGCGSGPGSAGGT